MRVETFWLKEGLCTEVTVDAGRGRTDAEDPGVLQLIRVEEQLASVAAVRSRANHLILCVSVRDEAPTSPRSGSAVRLGDDRGERLDADGSLSARQDGPSRLPNKGSPGGVTSPCPLGADPLPCGSWPA